jgi:hypothetical protein
MMKTKLSIYVLSIVGLLFSQMQSIQAEDVFYYSRDKKIFVKERADKVFLILDLKIATEEKMEDLISEIESFGLVADIGTEEKVISPFVLIETKNGNDVPSTLYESCKANEMILSATNVLECEDGTFQGLTDEFAVKLKSPSFYGQLEELALQNRCIIVKDQWVGVDSYMLSVSKTSELNSMQTANLFYETGLFKFAEPESVRLNVLNTAIPGISGSGAELFQNYPNPSGEETIIRYTLPQTGKSAQIVISNTAGNIVRQIPLQAGTESITIEGGALSAGIYYYSLYVGNSLVDTKKMILTK